MTSGTSAPRFHHWEAVIRPGAWAVVSKAVLVGLAVQAVGTLPWSALAALNIESCPSIPFAAPLAAGYLWVFWRWLGGSGPPRATASARCSALRAGSLSAQGWALSLVAGMAGLSGVVAALIALRRIAPFPQIDIPSLAGVPSATVLSLVVMSAVVAGVVEEAAFRGYMQFRLEQHLGAAESIAITSAVFGAIHMSHGLSLIRFLADAAFGVVYGVLAWAAGSILPGLVLHAGLDALQFLSVRRLRPALESAQNAGADTWFWVLLGLATVLVIAYGTATRILLHRRDAGSRRVSAKRR